MFQGPFEVVTCSHKLGTSDSVLHAEMFQEVMAGRINTCKDNAIVNVIVKAGT